jgi:hypothetical protein
MSPPGGRRPVLTRGVFAIEDQRLPLPGLGDAQILPDWAHNLMRKPLAQKCPV